MNRSPRQKNKRILTGAVCLLLCVVLSSSLLFARLADFLEADATHYIPLTRSSGLTTVTADTPRAALLPQPGKPVLLAASPILTASWFQAYDDNTVWSGQTQVEIFRAEYDGTGGQITVRGQNGDKLIAPGTVNTYDFALKNTSTHPVKYQMSMEAYIEGTDLVIPVEARVWTQNNQYLCGSQEAPAPVLELNQVSDQGTLTPGYVMPYTLQWEWPFEGDDALDTTLGNLATEQDLTLTIVINTVASYEPGGEGGIPQTGDTSQILLYSCMMLASLAGLLLLLLIKPRREESHG